MSTGLPVEILLVEDSESDLKLALRALRNRSSAAATSSSSVKVVLMKRS